MGPGPCGGKGHILTRCLPVSPQESSDSTQTTIEDEDTKGIQSPHLWGWWAGHWRVGSWDSKGHVLRRGADLFRATAPPEPGYGLVLGGLGQSIQAEPGGPGHPDQRGSHCPGWDGSLHGPPSCSGSCAPSFHGGICCFFSQRSLNLCLPSWQLICGWAARGISWAHCWGAGCRDVCPIPHSGIPG